MKNQTSYFNIAHRGARSLAPENTMPAFVKAWQVGAHGIETDVSVTADGVLILYHDETFKRTTDVNKVYPKRKNDQLHSFTWTEIQSLDAGSWFCETDPFGTIAQGVVLDEELTAYTLTRVPRLDELLTFVKEKSMFVNIEIKPLPENNSFFPVVEKVAESIEQAKLDPYLYSISSFHHPFLLEASKLLPEAELNALIGGEITKPNDWGNYEFAIYNANVDKIDVMQLEKALKQGCRVNLYTVNRLAEMQRYLALGVDKIITDFPQLLSGYTNP